MDPLEKLAQDARVTVRRGGPANAEGRAVVYWMQRAQRAVDNPALETAVRAANLLKKPVVVFAGIVRDYPNANLRSYSFFAEGLKTVARGLERRGIGFVLRVWPENDLIKFCEEISPCLVVSDENPIREPERWRQTFAKKLRVPFWTVDADVIVPSHLLLKEQYGARTIRPRITALLDEFLVPVGKLKPRVRWQPEKKIASLSTEADLLENLPINRAVEPVASLHGGTDEGLKLLKSFLRERLAGYDEGRNHPDQDHTSRLSPYLHFGHLGPHTVALAVKECGRARPRPRGVPRTVDCAARTGHQFLPLQSELRQPQVRGTLGAAHPRGTRAATSASISIPNGSLKTPKRTIPCGTPHNGRW